MLGFGGIGADQLQHQQLILVIIETLAVTELIVKIEVVVLLVFVEV
jgi:hypothetical protein